MNRNLVLVSALGAGLLAAAAVAQTATPAPAAAPATPAAAAATPPAAAPVAPHAIPAKIALVACEQAVFATNEGQQAVQAVQKKYEPKKAQIDTLAQEVDSLKKQLQSAPTTTTDEEHAVRLKAIDTKEKQLNRDAEDAQTAYNADLQEAYAKVAQKVSVTLKTYVAAGCEQSAEPGDVGGAEHGCDAGCGGCLQRILGRGRSCSFGPFGEPSPSFGHHGSEACGAEAGCSQIIGNLDNGSREGRPRRGLPFCACFSPGDRRKILWKNLWIAGWGRGSQPRGSA